MTNELTSQSATKLVALIRARAVSPVEIVEAQLDRIGRLNSRLNAIVSLASDAVDRAREAEASIMRGADVGPLHGLPITIKDTIETKGLLTTSGSLLRAAHIPLDDAPAVALLKAAGAIVLGKTNVPEMAIPYECDNPIFGRTNNPHDLSLTPGGSSGGEAAAISACLSPAGLGSDLSGSIRVPAHFCGIVGLKPTTARVPVAGHFPPAIGPSVAGAVVGPMARHVEDLALMLKVLTRSQAVDSTDAYEASVRPASFDFRGWRAAAYVDEKRAPVTNETYQALRDALDALRMAGLVITEEEPPGLGRAIDLWPALFLHASAVQLKEIYSGHEGQAGPVVRAAITSADRMPPPSSGEIGSSWREREALCAALDHWMSDTPLIVAPVGAVPAFEHGASRVHAGGNDLSIFRAFGYSRAFNVLGLPAVSVPTGRSREGLPIGVQIVGRPFEDESVLAAALIIEKTLGGWTQPELPMP